MPDDVSTGSEPGSNCTNYNGTLSIVYHIVMPCLPFFRSKKLDPAKRFGELEEGKLSYLI